MKSLVQYSIVLIFISLVLESCATICGGSKYHAQVVVAKHPNAEIYYQGQPRGHGTAFISEKRKLANKFSVSIKQKGCEEQSFYFRSKRFRTWAFIGTVATWGYYGIGLDFITGALWKPNAKDPGITQLDTKNFLYTINYTGCSSSTIEKEEEEVSPPVQDKLVDVVYLKNGSIIRGTLLDQDPTKFVKIQTADGSIFVFKIEEIEKVTRE